MKRRAFISLLGGAAAWPLTAGAQQRDQVRRIGVLMSAVEGDQSELEAFAQGLAELGWTVGRNVRIEYRWGAIRCRIDATIREGAYRAAARPHSFT